MARITSIASNGSARCPAGIVVTVGCGVIGSLPGCRSWPYRH
ncbi:hypothetical protein ACFFX0_28875 [Citricoccus parietis]|uniref:Uncharacterized protein n=1 Tax=Citricoccus parietis TaxID=592307 RepID=A0ABV5G5S4_9MICC